VAVAWARACATCAALLADLLTIRRAIPEAAIPMRSRDYRLTATQASALRHGPIRAWFAALGTARDTITRPIAASLVGLGLAGLLLGTVPAGLAPGGPAGAPGQVMTLEGGRGLAAAPTEPPSDAGLRPEIVGGPSAHPATSSPPDGSQAAPPALATLSLTLLAAGTALFGMRRAAGARRRMR
jgi:hypothetical protein